MKILSRPNGSAFASLSGMRLPSMTASPCLHWPRNGSHPKNLNSGNSAARPLRRDKGENCMRIFLQGRAGKTLLMNPLLLNLLMSLNLANLPTSPNMLLQGSSPIGSGTRLRRPNPSLKFRDLSRLSGAIPVGLPRVNPFSVWSQLSLALSNPMTPPTIELMHNRISNYDPHSNTLLDLHPGLLQSPYLLEHPIGPMALKAKKKTKDPDLPTLRESLMSPEAEQWWKAMDKEITSLEEKGTWTVVDRSEVPAGCEVIPATWVQRIKRHPDGSMNKFKSRLCVRGDIMKQSFQGSAYSPLVGWPTIRAALLLAATHGWHSRQVDFTLAFCQSPQKRPVYMELPQYYRPKGCTDRDVVLKLNKSLYGQIDSPLLFYEHLSKGMKSLGFLPSDSDPCLFIHQKEKIMVLNYCDDQIWLSPDNALIEKYVKRLDQMGYDLTLEEDSNLFGFLGIDFKCTGKTIELTQQGLIKKVLAYTKMSQASP